MAKKSRQFTRTSQAPSPVDDREHGVSNALFVPWDLTGKATDNADRDDARKLGAFQMSQHAVAILNVDFDSLAVELIDGYHRDGENLTSYAVLEPDNWIARLHTGKGISGKDNTWDIRLIADHCNKTNDRRHRSTMVIDQFNEQHWAWLNDLFWVTARQASVRDKEIQLDAAGFLSQFTKEEGFAERGALALNISRNAGYVADPFYMAQFAHVFCFLDTPPIDSDREVCEPPDQSDELGIRGDAQFKYPPSEDGKERFASFVPVERPEDEPVSDGEDLHEVFLYVDTEKERDLLPLDTNPDSQSNMRTLPKIPRHPFRFYVQQDNYEPTYDYSYHSPPPDSYYYGAVAAAYGPQPVPTGGRGGGDSGAPTPSQTGGGTTTLPDGTQVDNVATLDEQWEMFQPGSGHSHPSTQAQHGWSEPESPEFSQRVNIFELGDGSANVVGTFYASKPKGTSHLVVDIDIKPADPIPAGKYVEMVLQVGAFSGKNPPEVFYHAAIKIDSTASHINWVRQPFQFGGFPKDEDIVFICLLERRNDLDDVDSRPDVEIWTLRHKASRRNNYRYGVA